MKEVLSFLTFGIGTLFLVAFLDAFKLLAMARSRHIGYRPGTSQPPREVVTPCKRCSLSYGASAMDGHLFLLFVLATFLGGFVSGFSGFAMGLVVSGIWLHIITPVQTAALIAG